MGNQLGMATGTGVECNSQQSVGFEGEPDVPNCKTWAPTLGISVIVGSTDICVSVHMYVQIYLYFISIS